MDAFKYTAFRKSERKSTCLVLRIQSAAVFGSITLSIWSLIAAESTEAHYRGNVPISWRPGKDIGVKEKGLDHC